MALFWVDGAVVMVVLFWKRGSGPLPLVRVKEGFHEN